MLTEIPTEFEDVDGPHDDGVERVIRASEDFVHHGEQIERTTEFHFLEDGGVHLVQKLENLGVIDTMTLNAAVAYRLMDELSPDDDGPDGTLVEDCTECEWSEEWGGGSATDDPAIKHAEATGHTVTTRPKGVADGD